jgi:hypothetical protein
MTGTHGVHGTHEVVLDGLALGLKQHIAKLFSVLMADDPTSTKRFAAGIARSVVAYEEAVAIAERMAEAESQPQRVEDGKLPYIGG